MVTIIAEGITHIDAKGDGRHFISNGKDQAVKLWDLRRCHSQADLARGVSSMRGLPRYQWCADLWELDPRLQCRQHQDRATSAAAGHLLHARPVPLPVVRPLSCFVIRRPDPTGFSARLLLASLQSLIQTAFQAQQVVSWPRLWPILAWHHCSSSGSRQWRELHSPHFLAALQGLPVDGIPGEPPQHRAPPRRLPHDVRAVLHPTC